MAKLQDIPDINKKEIPKVVLTPEVEAEREIRRYIRKDGVFIKDVEQLFARDTGKIKEGRIVYEQTKSLEEATKIIVDLCRKSGRKIEHDSLTGRPKAVPGWNLQINVPGMEQSEQNASVEPDQVIRNRQNDQLIQDLRKSNEELTARLARLEAGQQEPEPVPQPEPEPDTESEGRGHKKGKTEKTESEGRGHKKAKTEK